MTNLLSHGQLLTALVTVLALLLYMYMGGRVGRARGKHKIEAPSVIGHPEFERAYRVQMNTVEQLVVFLPALWLATLYFTTLPWLPAALGVLWIIGRFLYMQAYIADPPKRELGFGVSALAEVALLVLAIAGIVMAWNAS